MAYKISGFVFILLFSLSCGLTGQVIVQEEQAVELSNELLSRIVDANRSYINEGEVADYIPELGKANPNDIAVVIIDENGQIFKAGDTDKTFTIQSISKLIGLMIAVEDLGEEVVFSKLGYYGTNKAFYHYANLETDGKPLNPMMNAGAILTTSLIKGEGEEAFLRILERIRYITKNDKISLNEKVYHSEKLTGNRNRGIFHLLKSLDLTEGSEDKLDNYFKQCSIEVSAEDLAKIGYFFAHQGTRFDGDTRYKSTEMAQLIQSQMLIAGMYDFSGEYARRVGLPSKSGVGGGITVSVPGKAGIGVYSPALDEHGNSLAGYHMIEDLVRIFDWSLFQ